MSRSALLVMAVLAAEILPRLAAAQPPPRDLGDQVAAIRKELAELRAAAAQAQTLSQSVQELTARSVAIEQQIDRAARQGSLRADLVGTLDRLAAQAAALERDVASLRTQVAGIERPAAGQGPAGRVDYQRGFEWVTADGAYSLRLSGFFQPRYETSVAEGGDTINSATFRLRRARLVAGGHVGGEQLSYKLQLETTSGDAPALDYYLDYQLSPGLAVRVGQDKLYFTRVWWASDSSSDLIERPSASEGLRYDRDIGVWVHGELLGGRLSYHAGVSNGAGPNRRNDNIDIATLVRVDYTLVGGRFDAFSGNLSHDPELRLMVGAGTVHDLVLLPDRVGGTSVTNRDVDADGQIDNVRVWSSSVDAALRWRGFEVVAEGMWRHERWGTILEHSDNRVIAAVVEADGEGHRNYLAGYLHVSYPLVEQRLQISARVGHARVALLGVGGRQVDSAPPGDRQVEATGQIRHVLGPNLSLGGSYTYLNYNNRSGPEMPGDVEHLLIGQGQLNF